MVIRMMIDWLELVPESEGGYLRLASECHRNKSAERICRARLF